ncbi:MAG: YncE family protein [Gemmatimonas sp.]
MRNYQAKLLTVLVAAATLAACESDSAIADGVIADTAKPRVTLVKGSSTTDTLLPVTISARDNLGIKNIHVLLEGGVVATYDTTLTSASTAMDFGVQFRVPKSAPLGSTVNVRAIVTDGAGNQSDTATLVMTVGNLTPPVAVVTSPVVGTPVVVGKSLIVSLAGSARYRVRTLGFTIKGAFRYADSTNYNSPLKDSLSLLDTLAVPDSANGKTITVTPFVVDSLLQRVEGTPVTFDVKGSADLNTVPTVRNGVTARLETADTIFVEATDPVGIGFLGYEVRSLTGTLIAADSVASNGSFSTLVRTFRTKINVPSFPTRVIVSGFARNTNGRRDVSRGPTGAVQVDTVSIVAGYTNPLPDGGVVADAIYFPRNDRLYLTNIERNQIEVYNLADSAFKSAIVVGSRPWGIAAWPRNREGVMADTLLVANSGGTNVSYVDLNRGATGREVYRYPLPNMIAYTVTTVRSQTSDQLITQRTPHDFSDRPQYLATTCEAATATSGPCGDVTLVYSTTPTPGQTPPFANAGTVRWENLTRASSHFFFEQAVGQTAGRADTLEIIRFAANGVGKDSVLVPFQQTVNGISYSTVVRIDQLAFRDTTYVRNSGNFRSAVIGEGGPVLGSRAMNYDVTMGMDRSLPLPVYDLGISRPIDVSDFIANAFARIQGVGINFDGSLSAVKGDSTYIFDRTLRLQGILQSQSSGGGLDFHPANKGLNSTPLNSRLAFVASNQPVIDIFDTWCFKKVASVPVRDPIIGPVRASVRSGGQIVLVGATIRGVTLVALPDNFTTSCQ